MYLRSTAMVRYARCAIVTLLTCLGCSGGSDHDGSSTGGVPSSGGALVGGAANAGGTAAGGAGGGAGAPTVGGAVSSGGAMSSGGIMAAGGSVSSGGAVAQGGTVSSGGETSSGGTMAAGGAFTSGGSHSFGGQSGPGGMTAAGAAISSGGSLAAGGAESGGASAGGDSSSGGQAPTCPSPALSPGDSNQTVSVDGSSRSYVLHVPASYSGSIAAPLIVDFHGLGGSGTQERSSSPYPGVVDGEGVVMAFPSGESGPSGPAWNVGPCCVDSDDLAFARALVQQVESLACIDPKRVYAVGFSMGGGMSHYLACHAADIFAAVAPAAFDLLEENVGDCTPSRAITEISFRGTSDPIVPYDGGYSSVVPGMPITFLGAAGTFSKWAELNGCTGSPSGPDANNCQTYSQCDEGVEVTLCTKQGGSHEAGNAAVAWPVLKRHTLP